MQLIITTVQRILVIGNCGAGKSTFSKRLGALTGHPVIHLDQYYYKSNWRAPEAEEWKATVARLSARPSWIMDGNYRSTLTIRIDRADTVIFLDASTATCLWRITKRTLTYWRQQRPDTGAGCRERFDPNFYRYVVTFNSTRRGPLLAYLMRYEERKRILILDDRAATAFLQGAG